MIEYYEIEIREISTPDKVIHRDIFLDHIFYGITLWSFIFTVDELTNPIITVDMVRPEIPERIGRDISLSCYTYRFSRDTIIRDDIPPETESREGEMFDECWDDAHIDSGIDRMWSDKYASSDKERDDEMWRRRDDARIWVRLSTDSISRREFLSSEIRSWEDPILRIILRDWVRKSFTMISDFQHSIFEGSLCTGIRDNSIVYCPRDLHLSEK